MRWFVEVSSVSKTTEKKSYCVDADSWQRALQTARSLRDDPGPMTGFSIELLDDGFAAVDPIKRQRYAIRKAPDDAALTTPENAAKASQPPPPGGATAETSAEPAPAGATPAPAKATPKRPSRPPAPELKIPPKGAPKPKTPTPPRAAVAPAPLAVKPLEVVAKREQDASAASPLTYREYAYLAEGTPDRAEAERLLRTQLTQIQASLAATGTGKLVNLALFNTRFTGRPTAPPLATLTWKDWRGDAVVTFPEGSPAAAAPVAIAPSQPIAPKAAVAPSPAIAPQPAVVVAPPQPIAPPPQPVAVAPAAGAFPPVSPFAATVPHAPSPVAAIPPPVEPFPPAPPSNPATPPPRAGVAAPTPPTPPPPPVSSASPDSGPPSSSSRGAEAAARRLSSRPPPTSGGRARGDELIADLFEAMHDLQFLADAVEGADFCLALALDKMCAAGGLVHLYDMNRREFVITSAGGDGGPGLLLQRSAESDPILSLAMRRKRAVVIADARSSAEARSTARYIALGGARSLIVAPVALGGRLLGAIEVLNPKDDVPFNDNDSHALSYIAEQFAGFVAERGVLLERDQPLAPGRSAAR